MLALQNRYRATFEQHFSQLTHRSKRLTNEEFFNVLRNMMLQWLVYESRYYPDQFDIMCDLIKYKLWETVPHETKS